VETERPEHAFLVRTWRETGAGGGRAEWRGSVEHLPTKQRRYFRDLADLCAFVLTYQLAEDTKK
jgi:hypothetical protein